VYSFGILEIFFPTRPHLLLPSAASLGAKGNTILLVHYIAKYPLPQEITKYCKIEKPGIYF
jgi:hypothetical protein